MTNRMFSSTCTFLQATCLLRLEFFWPANLFIKHVLVSSARAWCTGKTQRNQVVREVGGGIRMGNTCNSMADSCQYMTKPTAML